MGCMGDSANLIEVLKEHFGPTGGRMHTGVEVGVHRGDLSARLLGEFPNLTLWMVDTWRSPPKDSPYARSGDSCAALSDSQQFECMQEARRVTEFAKERRTLLQFPSLQAQRIIGTPRLSFVFIDGSHVYDDVRDDIAAWWPRVEAQGILAGHDIDHPKDLRGVWGVRRAVEEFAEREQVAVQTLGSVWWAVKP